MRRYPGIIPLVELIVMHITDIYPSRVFTTTVHHMFFHPGKLPSLQAHDASLICNNKYCVLRCVPRLAELARRMLKSVDLQANVLFFPSSFREWLVDLQ